MTREERDELRKAMDGVTVEPTEPMECVAEIQKNRSLCECVRGRARF